MWRGLNRIYFRTLTLGKKERLCRIHFTQTSRTRRRHRWWESGVFLEAPGLWFIHGHYVRETLNISKSTRAALMGKQKGASNTQRLKEGEDERKEERRTRKSHQESDRETEISKPQLWNTENRLFSTPADLSLAVSNPNREFNVKKKSEYYKSGASIPYV